MGDRSPEEIIRVATASITECPSSGAYLSRAAAYIQLRQFKPAQDDLESAVELDPLLRQDPVWLVSYGAVLKEMDDCLGAEVYLRHGVARAVRHPEMMRSGRRMLSKLLMAQNEYRECLEHLDELLKLKWSEADERELLKDQATCLFYLEHFNKCAAVASCVIKVEPRCFAMLCVRARAYQRLGQHAEALADLDAADACAGSDENRKRVTIWRTWIILQKRGDRETHYGGDTVYGKDT